MPGAGAGAAKQFYPEPESEPEPDCFPGAGVGAGADQKWHSSASLVYGNYRHECSFKSYDQLSYMKRRRISKATKLQSRIFEILKISKMSKDFDNFFPTFPPQNQNFEKRKIC